MTTPHHEGHDHNHHSQETTTPVEAEEAVTGHTLHGHTHHDHHAPESIEGAAEHAGHSDYRGSEAHEGHEGHEAHGDHSGHGDHGDHGDHGGMHAGHATLMRDRFWISLVLTIPLLRYTPMLQEWFGFRPPVFPGSEWIPPILGTIIFVVGGFPFLSMARHELMQRQPGMMTLISLAITSSFIYSLGVILFAPGEEGFFWELATLIDVMLLGHWIELRSVGQAQGALRELAKLLPDQAERVLDSGQTELVPVDQLRVGDTVLVRPGAGVPADGEVISGESSVNEAMITGESRPVHKHPGEAVIAGTVNGSGSLRARVTQVGESTALAGIMRLVQDAQSSRSHAQTLAQKAAFYLTLIAIGAGLITFVGWSAITGSLPDAVRSTIGVLVVACPHALGLAIPLVVSISTTLSARNGLLVRERMALETAKDLNYVIFDKTGTLTKGEQGVVAVETTGMAEADALRLAAGVEGDSEHMVAQAIRGYAEERGVQPASVSGFDSLAGRGVRAAVDGTPYFVGGPQLVTEKGWTLPEGLRAGVERAEAAGQSVVYLANESGILAMFAIADVIREESAEAVRQLHALGLKVAMLTGDSEAVARSVAATLNIDTYFAQVLPEHKSDRVRELQAGGNRVAMVGDGVNDAPALVTADVGIAIGAGTNVAIESADIILVRSDPRDVVKIIQLSRATYRKMIQNLIWATGYNVVAIPLAMGVLAPWGIVLAPAVGAALMSLSTIIVAINAQLLRGLTLAEPPSQPQPQAA